MADQTSHTPKSLPENFTNASRPTTLPPIRACLFDMDGLLIDSEDKYTIVTNIILQRYNRPKIPWSIKAQLQGRPGPSAGKIFNDWAQLPIPREQYLREAQELQREVFPNCRALPGVEMLLGRLSRARDMQMALATSSHRGNFEIKTGHIRGLFACFDEVHRVLGDDARIPAGHGKPAPDIYLLALKTINDKLKAEGKEEIMPKECLVFEDSVPGVEAGRRAGMQVVWCPHPGLLEEYSGREKEVLAGLTGEHERGKIAPEVKDTAGQPVEGGPGEIDDGWAVLLATLENFPYDRFGIQA